MQTPNPLSLSTHYLKMIPSGSLNPMATGTGFIYEVESNFYLITNGHNVTRVNPDTNKRIIDSAAFPVEIHTKVRAIAKDNPAFMTTSFVKLPLYYDEEFTKPTWFIHPTHGYKIDVVAIPMTNRESLPEEVRFYPINKYQFDEYNLEVADDVFILGYPFDITGGKELPIWKRGSIATEPFVDIEGLPKFLVDSATRSGMSGSPVIVNRNGVHGFIDGKPTGKEVIGQVSMFGGIYSGRIGNNNNLEAQLGIVWKSHVIDEIINGGRISGIEFQMI